MSLKHWLFATIYALGASVSLTFHAPGPALYCVIVAAMYVVDGAIEGTLPRRLPHRGAR